MRDTNEPGSRETGSVRPDPEQAKVIKPGSGQQPANEVKDKAALTRDSASNPVAADMQQFIGRQLRAVYDDVAQQPIPDRFLELMKQLDSKTAAR